MSYPLSSEYRFGNAPTGPAGTAGHGGSPRPVGDRPQGASQLGRGSQSSCAGRWRGCLPATEPRCHCLRRKWRGGGPPRALVWALLRHQGRCWDPAETADRSPVEREAKEELGQALHSAALTRCRRPGREPRRKCQVSSHPAIEVHEGGPVATSVPRDDHGPVEDSARREGPTLSPPGEFSIQGSLLRLHVQDWGAGLPCAALW